MVKSTASRIADAVSALPRRVLIFAGAGVALLIIIAFALSTCGQPTQSDQPNSDQASTGGQSAQEAALPEGATKVSFVAVGDNLPDEYIGYVADKKAGVEDDGKFDYSFLFDNIAPYIQGADLAYINQETHIGGNDIGVSGYPSFNTTDEMADAVVNVGFDFVASATNHSYDHGAEALEHSLSVWEKQPVAFTGTAVTAEQYDHIATQQRNGITFELLNYCYGVNGYEESELPPYAVSFIHEDRIREDVARAKEEADVVLVAMHWGTENLMEADEEQEKYAQLLADLDVDVVLGSHPHVIGPMKWIANSNGSGHETLVAYSLGNFVADHETPNDINVLEDMLNCDFIRYADSPDVHVENVKWTPLVCHSNENRDDFAIYTVDDYPDDLAKKNRALSEKSDPKGWLRTKTEEVVGKQWFDGQQGNSNDVGNDNGDASGSGNASNAG